VFAGWKRDIQELARAPNVWVKLAAWAWRICGFGFHKRDVLPSSEELAQAGGRTSDLRRGLRS